MSREKVEAFLVILLVMALGAILWLGVIAISTMLNWNL